MKRINVLPLDISKRNQHSLKIALGHKRLSIIDLSEKANQPLCDSSGEYWIIFNGELYNYLELRKQLHEQGVIFRTNSDTEVVLKSYMFWGSACFKKFNGIQVLSSIN